MALRVRLVCCILQTSWQEGMHSVRVRAGLGAKSRRVDKGWTRNYL